MITKLWFRHTVPLFTATDGFVRTWTVPVAEAMQPAAEVPDKVTW
jgi:hypothetical protein